ncbi:MAG: GNAT family N-acetyltransferase [Spirochaetaceae bacterium]|nr:MAG: GNAT family N-acetyltransferase [Spirochaetaceae bacterium]
MRYICLHDKPVIERYLKRDVPLHIYALGDLDDFFWPYTQWWGLRSADPGSSGSEDLEAVTLLYVASSTPTLLALGTDHEPLSSLIESIAHLLPERFYAHLSPGVAPSLAERFRLTPHGLHLKMALTGAGIGGDSVEDDGAQAPVRLSTEDLPALRELYDQAYPDNWFDARMLETGRYVGIREGSRIVSVAGIHVYSPRYRVAALGNITTLPTHRGRGYAGSAIGMLCSILADEGLDVGLNVKADNAAAIACYRKSGFVTIAEYEEYEVSRRSTRE